MTLKRLSVDSGLQSNFDERDSLKREKASRLAVRSDSFRRQNVRRLARLSCKRERVDALFSSSRLSNFDCRR
jgi:hypothetical protein